MAVLDWFVAHEEIRQLAARYVLAVDSRDLDALVELFVDDVQVDRSTFGRDALREEFDRSLGLPPANWPEHHDGMGTVPECWETWREFWAETDE